MPERPRLALLVATALAVASPACSDGAERVESPTSLPATTTTIRAVTTIPTTTATTVAAHPAATQFPATVRADLTEVHDFPGPPDKGSISLALERNRPEICYQILLRETDRPTEIHIHEGAATVASLDAQIGTPGQAGAGERGGRGGFVGTRPRCQPADASLVERLLAEPSRFSADVHTATAPGGAVRGPFTR